MIDKSSLLTLIRQERAAFNQRMLALPAEQWERPIAPGGMTPKELVYHIAWHERQMTGMLQARALVGSPWWDLPTDQRNALIQAEAAPLTVEQVQDDAAKAIDQLLVALEALPGEALNDPTAFADMPPDWNPAELIAQNTTQHYRDH